MALRPLLFSWTSNTWIESQQPLIFFDPSPTIQPRRLATVVQRGGVKSRSGAMAADSRRELDRPGQRTLLDEDNAREPVVQVPQVDGRDTAFVVHLAVSVKCSVSRNLFHNENNGVREY